MISPGLLKRGGVIMDGHNDQLVSKGTGTTIAHYRWKANISTLALRDEELRFHFAALSNNSITKQFE